jgi:hypothetical protein
MIETGTGDRFDILDVPSPLLDCFRLASENPIAVHRRSAGRERKALRDRTHRTVVFAPLVDHKFARSPSRDRPHCKIGLKRLKLRGAYEQKINRFVRLLHLRSKWQAPFIRRARHQGEVVCFVSRPELLIGLETTLQTEVEGKIVLPLREPMVVFEESQELLGRAQVVIGASPGSSSW